MGVCGAGVCISGIGSGHMGRLSMYSVIYSCDVCEWWGVGYSEVIMFSITLCTTFVDCEEFLFIVCTGGCRALFTTG